MLLYLDMYDVVVIVGGMGEGYILCGVLYEMIWIVKFGNELVWILCFLWGIIIKIFIIKDLYCNDIVVFWVLCIDYKYYLF